MNQVQSAILPEAMQNCIVIEARVVDCEQLKSSCRESLQLLKTCQQQNPKAMLGMCIGFGAPFWDKLKQANEAPELKPFVELGNGLAPATQSDLFIHIQSLSHAANMQLALSLLAEFAGAISVVSETHGYRLQDDRGLDGFVDGTENPTGELRLETGVGSGTDYAGTYVLVQRYRHDLNKWSKLDHNRQAAIVGRSKQTDEELPKDVRLPDSHLGRVDLKEDGKGLKIIRQSLPYGSASGEHGLLFIAYCARLYNIEQQLLSMFGHTDGKTDLLLSNLSSAISGAYYFIPSQSRLINL